MGHYERHKASLIVAFGVMCILSPLLFSILSLNLDGANGSVSVWGQITLVIILPICLIQNVLKNCWPIW